ncbi:MAG: transcriptional regulator, AraC family [Herbinix sp.]|jgi:AraC-like DNA-binding protein|nr:transcriptional regulator, AraC family [Herbinix sp.]
MISTLEGIRETVNFAENSTIKLYDNDEAEDYPNHWHTPLEIVMPTLSEYQTVCNDVTINLRVGDILIIAPGTVHRFYAPKVGKRIIFQAELSEFNSIREFDAFTALIQPALLITPEEAPLIHTQIVELIKDITDEYQANAQLMNVSIYSKLFQIMVLISRNYSRTSNSFSGAKTCKQQEYLMKFHSICDYINQNCTENLSLDTIADMAGFSKFHFSRLFKEFTNVSFYKYLNARRIACAERLLIDPNMNITEVAFRSGFNNISAFIRMFRIVKNCTPTEFRNMYQGRVDMN